MLPEEMPGHPLTKQRTSRYLKSCTQRLHLSMVSLQDWAHIIHSKQHSSICFFLWLTFPCLWQTPTCSSEPSSGHGQSPVTAVPRFWGLVTKVYTLSGNMLYFLAINIILQAKCSMNALVDVCFQWLSLPAYSNKDRKAEKLQSIS